jgi:hypothetical protein
MKKNKPMLFVIGVIIIILVYHAINKYKRYSYGINSVAKVCQIKSTGKTYYVQYIYFIDNKKYTSKNQMGFKNKGRLGDFYKIIYSSKNPKNVEIFLDEKITDTTLILKAGFSEEDIENMK